MKTTLFKSIVAFTAMLLLVAGMTNFAQAQGTTAITYQGRLNAATGPANGPYDLRFAVYDANVAGNFIAGPVMNTAVAVSNGLFTVSLDFGAGVFTGTNYRVELGVRTNGGGVFSTLVPRQQLTPAPYAIYAPQAAQAGFALQANSATSLSAASPQINSLYPPGAVMAYAGAVAPPGWLMCNSIVPVSRTTYAALFAAIGTAYGVGDGFTTFNLPDMRGRTGIGSGTGLGLSSRNLGQTLGEEVHTLTQAEMPSHTHTEQSAGSHNHGLYPSGPAGANVPGISWNVNGSGQIHYAPPG